MPIFVSARTLKDVIDRLSVAAVTASLADYLIFKRALQISRQQTNKERSKEPTSVVTGMKSAPFVQAIEEQTLRVPADTENNNVVENRYYVPFASKRDNTLGYRSQKYTSNGPSDTVSRWQSRTIKPLVLVADSKPKAYAVGKLSVEKLEAFFLVKGAQNNFSGEKPGLLDTAVWWLRFTNLEEIFGANPSDADLVKFFVDQFALTKTEIDALFKRDDLEPEPELSSKTGAEK